MVIFVFKYTDIAKIQVAVSVDKQRTLIRIYMENIYFRNQY